jgi:excisionase family DNA binding protein
MGGFVKTGVAKKWMTVPEVAQHFSCSKRYVYTMVETGRLTVINLSGEIGKRGMRISSYSIQQLEKTNVIDPDDYNE